MTTKLEVNCLIFVAQNGIDHPKSLAIGKWFASRGKQRLMWQFFDEGARVDTNQARSARFNRWLRGKS